MYCRELVVALVAIASCKEPSDPIVTTTTRPADAAIAMPRSTVVLRAGSTLSQSPYRNALLVAVLNGDLWLLHATPDVGGGGIATLGDRSNGSTGTATTPAAVARLVDDDGVVIITDIKTPVRQLLPLMSALAGKPWGMAVARNDTLGMLRPVPGDPPPKADDDLVELALWIEPHRVSIGVSQINQIVVRTTDHSELVKTLKKQHDAFFAFRTDLVFGTHPDVTAGELVDVLDAAFEGNFNTFRWTPQTKLPLKFGEGIGVDAIARPDVGVTGLAPAVKNVGVGGSSRDVGSYTAAVIDRVVMAHVREYETCYQNEIAREPEVANSLANTIDVAINIGADGRVSSVVPIGSSFPTDRVGRCIRLTMKGLEFPKPAAVNLITYKLYFWSRT